MVTAEREYLNLTKRLREIEVLTLSNEFNDFKTNKLLELKKESNELIVKMGSREHEYAFQTTVSRINSKIDSINAKARFKLQVIISAVILIVGLFNVYIQLCLKP